MKKYLLLILSLLLTFTLTGCFEKQEDKKEIKLIDKLGFEEGCYSSGNTEHYICFTQDSSYYDVLYKNNTYYRDDYYAKSPLTEDNKYSYKYVPEDEYFSIYYYESNQEYLALMCHPEETNKIKCANITNVTGKAEMTDVYYNKVDKEFNKEIIENLPLYERNKEFTIIFNGEELTCNLTRSYSIINSFASSDIRNCLNKNYNEEYTITELDETGSWQIYTKKDWENLPNNDGLMGKYEILKNNYSYYVTVNNKTFKYTQAFPIDPIDSSEKMIVNITKK